MSRYQATLSFAFRKDVRNTLVWSERHFGMEASDRYRALIRRAILDLQADPNRLGTKPRTDLASTLWTYHLNHSRLHVEGDPVKMPRHFVLYRVAGHAVDLARLLHDSRDLSRHIPKEFL